ncbi:MAG: LptF/LptG family permease [Luteolibacter sp.]
MPLVLAAMGVGLYAFLLPAETLAVKQQLLGFPDSDLPTHLARPLVLTGLCFLPALASLMYCFGCTLDRYIARQFAGIFGICLVALFMIWLLMDLSDKISDFQKTPNPFQTILSFYSTRLPAVLLLLLPYSLLLSLLYSLGKLSGSREIIAMIQAGRGVLRITLPLIIAGFFFSLLSMGLNYHWAPVAEDTADDILAEASRKQKDPETEVASTVEGSLAEASGKQATEASNVLYRNSKNRRLWMIGAFPHDYQKGEPLLNVEITTTRPDETLETRLTAKRALWDRQTRTWTFEEPVIGHFEPGQPTTFETPHKSVKINSWPETPWQLIKPGLSAAYLGIPDLTSWLNSNARNAETTDASPYLTQWHYRWALPFTCLVTVLLATPLAIHFSRRGAGGGIFIAVVLSALMLLCTNISLALGESGTLRPAHAAWLPNIAFTLLGLYLFHRRISGRPIYLVLRRLLPGND